MTRHSSFTGTLILTAFFALALHAVSYSEPPEPLYIGVDAAPETVESVAKDLQKIVVLCATDPATPDVGDLVRLMAFDESTGAQVGTPYFSFPPNPIYPPSPCLAQTREHILLSRQVGVPSVMLVTSDMIIQEAPVLFSRDGQISLGSWAESPPPYDVCETGKVTAVCEMTSDENPIGQWLLVIGTENGYLAEIGRNPDGALVGLGIYPVAVPPNPVYPVSNLGIIPQDGYTAVGVGFGDGIRGVRFPSDGGAPIPEFTLRYPDPGPPGMPQFSAAHPPDPGMPTPIVLANTADGTIDIAHIPSNASGEITLLAIRLPPYNEPEINDEVIVGSLTMHAMNDSAIYYDPWFTDSTGFSGCLLDVSSGFAGECVWCCNTAGDFNNDDVFNIADVTAGIAYIFSGGDAPGCDDEADFDGSNAFNIADVTAGIAYIFSGGAAPVCGGTGS